MSKVTVNHNLRTHRYEIDEGQTTASQLRGDPQLKAVTGHGDNVDVLVGGNVVPDGYVLRAGDAVEFETRAARKANITAS